MSDAYNAYLQSDQWKDVSKRRKALDGYKCVVCGATGKLAAHHITYPSNWYNTKVSDIITVCPDCHRAIHRLIELHDKYKEAFKSDGSLMLATDKEYKGTTIYAVSSFTNGRDRLLVTECWRRNCFAYKDVKRLCLLLVAYAGVALNCPNTDIILRANDPTTVNGFSRLPLGGFGFTEVNSLLALCKDLHTENPNPVYNKARRKAKAASKTMIK